MRRVYSGNERITNVEITVVASTALKSQSDDKVRRFLRKSESDSPSFCRLVAKKCRATTSLCGCTNAPLSAEIAVARVVQSAIIEKFSTERQLARHPSLAESVPVRLSANFSNMKSQCLNVFTAFGEDGRMSRRSGLRIA